MARYRKIDSRVWNDEKFRAFSDDSKLAFMFCLTHPHMTSLGAMRATLPGLAAEIGWKTERLSKAFAEPFRKGMLKADETACFYWLPNFLKYNQPENPNVLKAWGAALELLPECELKAELCQSVSDYVQTLSEPFRKAFESLREGFGKPFRKPEPEPEPEPEQEQEETSAQRSDDSAPAADAFTTLPCVGSRPEFTVTHAFVEQMKPIYPGIDIERETLLAKGWLINNPTRRKTFDGMTRFLNAWYAREQNKQKANGGLYGQNLGSNGGGRPAVQRPAYTPRERAQKAGVPDLPGPDVCAH